ncbi:MAG: efflux RND transporter periplasmic adaptor subunit [Alphaproteobacteria bacterium]|jgi:HlyD family secretion protein|nr:efflux RND transporter periplasmic adaptor subunit [Alphaproteobacteria bacterium]MBU1607275.1 efflux RND transporter periplasmic adaptor subunit [Alphaproteobacteria bacterium]
MNYETSITGEGDRPLTSDPAGELDALEGENRKRNRRRLFIGIGIVIAALIAAAVAWQMTSSEAVPVADRDSQLPAVSVIAPGQTTVEGEITATGTLAARREMPVGVVGEGGRVVSVPVDAGDWVRQGQVLAVIDRSVQSQQVRSARAQIEVARSEANLAQANLDRALQLVERGFISTADVDRLTATRDGAVARLGVAQAQLGELQARNERLNIVAPAAGLVLARNVEPGQTVSAGSAPLFQIARGGEIEMLAQVGETQLSNLSTGVRAEVTPVGSEKTYIGQVWQLSPTIDPQDRQGTARIALSYEPGLRPGGFATARIASGTVVAPVLPESAVLSDDEGSFVYIIGSDNTAQRRSVTTGSVTPRGIVITEGLTGSERVVLRAGGFLTPGETVNPQLVENGGA